LYSIEVRSDCDYHGKVVGRQWYWDYEYFIDNTLIDIIKGGNSFGSFFKWYRALGDSLSSSLRLNSSKFDYSLKSVGFDVYKRKHDGLLPFRAGGIDRDSVFYIPVNKSTELRISTGDVIHS